MPAGKNKKKFYILLGFIGVMLLIGFSYAWLRLTLQAKKKVSILGGQLELVLDETTEGIQLTNVKPIYDSEGKQGLSYQFSLENKGTIAANYQIYLDDDEEAFAACTNCKVLEAKNIKYQLIRNGVEYVDTLGNSRVIDTGLIKGGSANKINYELRVWLSIHAGNEAMGSAFYGKIRVEAIQKTNERDATDANAPVLASNMIPVKYDGYHWVKAVNDKTWYNYDRQIWANAVTVKSDTRSAYQNANEGTRIKMEDILTMFVWIPRYSYTIKSEDGINYYGKQEVGRDTVPTKALPGEIDIKFIGTGEKDNGSAKYTGDEAASEWYTPPAFTFGDKELPGIWVGKFETGSVNGTSPGNVTTNNLVAIKPNITSWRSIQVSTLDLVSRGMTSGGNIYGFDNTYDSHAMKNSEWALVSYLTQSKYGKYGNGMYEGESKEIYINNYSGFKTGCSAGVPSAGASSTCAFEYNDITDRGNGTGAAGSGASTTGNIYGIYDMSGGAWEYTMGSYNKYSGYTTKSYTKEEAQQLPGHSTETNNIGGPYNSGYTGMCGYDGREWTGRSFPAAKYYDLYTTANTTTACNGGPCKGHALNEMTGWYSDSSNMVFAFYPWSVHGGHYNLDAGAGVFSFSNYDGAAHGDSFRVVLTP